ncbi:MAG: MaoC family dehydratase [Acidimicrobiia bacterium]|nr:MaoC family dehydratase [Acidimicrobiia bacterium]
MTEPQQMCDWSTRAVNLPEHDSNPIHTDEGARAKGFPAALVAGVTVYAYLSHLPATAWGPGWVSGGGAHVRFRSPVLDGDTVDCVALDGDIVEGRVGGEVRARSEMFRTAPDLPTRPGEALEPYEFVLEQPWLDYGERGGDDHPLYTEQEIAHPVAWLTIANRFFGDQLVNGPWIHVRSIVAHHGVAPLGSTISAEAVVVDRFDSRAGRRAIADVRIHADGALVATLEHEAIIELS